MQSDVKKVDMAARKNWLLGNGTITLPRWVFAVGGLLLLAIALD